ncbi:MAG: glycosyltransferase [Candidatus Gottesmanbacteria bacterium]|nr:glycosyltransferase [Candidatus Gottesmanbacteria bacterium]
MKLLHRPYLTLILPAYNESYRLVPGLTAAIGYLQKQPYRWEIIIVDDGSVVPVTKLLQDQRAYRRLRTYPVTVFRLPVNRGKGAAIARGVAAAQGKYIVFSDVDFSVSITMLPLLLSELSRSPVVIGSRRAPGSVIGMHQPILRETAGRIFTYCSNLLLGLRVFDSTCGFKGFERHAAKRLFRGLVIGGWVFDAEILWRARHWHMQIVQIPVHWSDKKGTRVHGKDVIHAWADLLKLWAYTSAQA